MKISIFVTCTDPIERQDLFHEALEGYRMLADELIIVDGSANKDSLSGPKLWDKVIYHPWPEEFEWKFIGEQFQRGYDACQGDWVIRMDLDYILHETDISLIRNKLNKLKRAAGASFWKYQFLLADRYNLKNRTVNILNKGRMGGRIKLNGGGDLCQPTVDDHELIKVPEIGAPIYNYDFLKKTEETVRKDIGRFARAWHSTFEAYKLGGPDDNSAFQKFLAMQTGRINKPHQIIPLRSHPKWMKNTISRLTKQNFGHSFWGRVATATYFE